MTTRKLTRRIVLGIGIPAALATGAIAAAASSNGSPASSERTATTITQTAPGSTGFVTVREPGEDVRGNADEAEHQNDADTGHHGSNSGPGNGADHSSDHGSRHDDSRGHDAGDDHGGSRHGSDD